MARKPFIPTQDPYHVSTRCINKDWFAAPLSDVWQTMSEVLTKTQLVYSIQIHSYVLMSNHFHLIVTTPDLNLSQAMNYFLRESSRELLKRTERLNCTFTPRFFRSRIQTHQEFLKVYKYVYRNPVEAGICDQVEAYPWSTLHSLIGMSRLTIPLVKDEILFEKTEQTLKWLNEAPHPHHYHLVKKALRKPEFKFPKKFEGAVQQFTNRGY